MVKYIKILIYRVRSILNTYIAYSNLTEETILGWIQSIEDDPALQAELQLRLEKSSPIL